MHPWRFGSAAVNSPLNSLSAPRMKDADSPPPGEDAEPIDIAFAAFLKACDSGELEDRQTFLARFPELADDLAELLDAAEMLGGVTPGPEMAETQVLPTIPQDGETVGVHVDPDKGGTIKATLPLAQRPAGDSGPTLPFQLGDYLLESILGRGGMGVVYKAIQQSLQRTVAVKMIRSGMLASVDEVQRFFAEARAAAKLHHPNIVGIFHFGHREGHYFFSMECVTGTDLARKLEDGPIEPEQAARYVRDVARAIDYAHQKNVVHRDLKPANVLIDEAENVRVTDFGLAKQIDCDSSLTNSGVAVGTPAFMSPEQASGKSDRFGVVGDVYSMGAILYAALTGEPPFVGRSLIETMTMVMNDPPRRPRQLNSAVPKELETICLKCLEKPPHKRYPSAAALADDLDRFLLDEPILAKPQPPLVRAIRWLEAVPLVAALTGRRRLATASQSHRRFQAALLMLMFLIPLSLLGLVAFQQSQAQRMPRKVRLAGGLQGGVYGHVSQSIAERLRRDVGVEIEVFASGGSLDNRQRLLSRQVHMAPLQASAISDNQLRVAAPLFYEAVHVLVRNPQEVASVADLRGRTVAVGPDGSGSRMVAEYLFDSYDLDPASTTRRVIAWPDLPANPDVQVAVICVGVGSSLVETMLRDGWHLIPIDNPIDVALQHPTLTPMQITAKDFPKAKVPAAGIATVGTTAFLAVHAETPDILVTETLQAIYQDPPLLRGMISRRNAAEWQGLAFHRAARAFYAQ